MSEDKTRDIDLSKFKEEVLEAYPSKVAKKRASRRWPPGFSPDGESLAKLISLGYVTPDQRDWLLDSFKDYAHSKAMSSPNWQASLRTYAGSSITARSFQAHYGFYPGAQAPSPGAVSSIVSAPSAPSALGAPETPRQLMDRLQGRSGMSSARTPTRTFSEQTGADNRALMFGAAAAPSQPLHRCADGTYSDS